MFHISLNNYLVFKDYLLFKNVDEYSEVRMVKGGNRMMLIDNFGE